MVEEEEIFSHAPLVSRNQVRVAEDGPDGFFEVVIVFAAGIGLVPEHQARPLIIAHRGGATVGEQIHKDALAGT